MKLCERCGNEINQIKCPYCGQIQKDIPTPSSKPKGFQKINIKIGLPTVSEAIRTAKAELRKARKENIGVVKLVHGYGSSGTGGAIRVNLRAELKRMLDSGLLRSVIHGESFSRGNCKQLLHRFPSLKSDHDMGRRNRGITIVEL